MGKSLLEKYGKASLKLLKPDEIAKWLLFLREDKRLKEEKGQKEAVKKIEETIKIYEQCLEEG